MDILFYAFRPEQLHYASAALGDMSMDREDDALTFAIKALLVRHEAYVAEAENSKWEMNQRIDYLEKNKKELEDENARILQESRDLLDQLEHLNTSTLDSQAHIESLEATLHSTNLELRRLEGLANRAQELEIQIIELEREQHELSQTLTSTESEEKTALRRWRAAERKLKEVQEQLERIENEAHNEKQRHEEVLRRMERQRLVDKELEEKATANANSGQNVVGHFVKDILQDNVNLQMGIVELRELLMNSNDEVQKLREQLMAHQPAEELEPVKEQTPVSLDAEIAPKENTPSTPQAVHVHHHYHVPAIKKDDSRRTVPRRKRGVVVPIGNGFHSRSNSRSRIRPAQASIAATILSQTSTTVPSPRAPRRWSAQSYGGSDFASSAPSSPQSNYRNSVLFDRMSMDQTMEYSRPTSPDSSIDPMSPAFQPSHRKKISEFSVNSSRTRSNETIHEESDIDVPEMSPLEDPKDELTVHDDSEIGTKSKPKEAFDPFASHHKAPTLRRSASHESILSIAGTDIHTLHSRPSQLSITKSGAFRRGQMGPSSAVLSMEPALGTAELSTPNITIGASDSRALLRSTAGLPRRPGSSSSNETLRSIEVKKSTNNGGGGWIWGRWGISPKPSHSLNSTTSSSTPAPFSNPEPPRQPTRAVTMPIKRLKENEDPMKMMLGRSPGINQSGPVPGWRRPVKPAPSQVVPSRVDFEALREVLEED